MCGLVHKNQIYLAFTSTRFLSVFHRFCSADATRLFSDLVRWTEASEFSQSLRKSRSISMARLWRDAKIRSNFASETIESFLSVSVDSASDKTVDVEYFRFSVSARRDRKKVSSSSAGVLMAGTPKTGASTGWDRFFSEVSSSSDDKSKWSCPDLLGSAGNRWLVGRVKKLENFRFTGSMLLRLFCHLETSVTWNNRHLWSGTRITESAERWIRLQCKVFDINVP